MEFRCGDHVSQLFSKRATSKRIGLNEQRKARPQPHIPALADDVLPRSSAMPLRLAGYKGERLNRRLS